MIRNILELIPQVRRNDMMLCETMEGHINQARGWGHQDLGSCSQPFQQHVNRTAQDIDSELVNVNLAIVQLQECRNILEACNYNYERFRNIAIGRIPFLTYSTAVSRKNGNRTQNKSNRVLSRKIWQRHLSEFL